MHPAYNRPRSPYGIKEPGSPPRPDPWYIRLANLVSTKSGRLVQRYQMQNTSGQIPADPRNLWSTQLQASWHRPTQPKADPITQPIQTPQFGAPWPDTVGSKDVPSDRRYRMDARPKFVGHMRPAYLPGSYVRPHQSEPYERFSGEKRLHPFVGGKNPSYRQDYLPVRIDDRIPPIRLVRPHRAGLALMPGIAQFGTRQTWGQGPESIVLPPVGFTRTPTQSVRSIAGVLSPKYGTGRERIPAVFTPTQVQ